MKRREVFEQLEPPPFGLERLRARLETERSKAPRLVLVASAVAAVLVAVLWPRPEAIDLTASLGLASTVEVAPLDPGTTAVLALPSSNPDVVLVRVSSLEGQTPGTP